MPRDLVHRNLIRNGFFNTIPGSIVPQTNAGTFLDGTANGSSSEGIYGGWWAGASVDKPVVFDTSTYFTPPASLKLSLLVNNQTLFTRSNGMKNFFPTADQPQGFELRPNTAYRLSFMMKTEYISGDANQGAYVQVFRHDRNGNHGSENNTPYVKTTTDWTQYTFDFTTDAYQTQGHLEPRVSGQSGAGTLFMNAWFDNFILVPLSPRTVA